MNARFFVLILLIAACGPTARTQCSATVRPIPSSSQQLAAPVGADLKPGEIIRYRQRLSNDDQLDLFSEADGSPFGGYSERGLIVERRNKAIQEFRLADLPALKRDPKEPDFDPSNSFRALAMIQGCTPKGPLEFVSFQWEGDLTSPALLVVITRQGTAYEFASLPTIGGGVFDISRSNSSNIAAWDNLHEGSCEACSTRYEIQRFSLESGRPVFRRKSTTKHKYSSDDPLFDYATRVRLVR